MPTYLYECKKCGRFEEFQKITDEPLDECPECNNKVKRVIGAPGIIFKGSGFYSTDSREGSNTINSKDDPKQVKNNKEETKTEDTNTTKESGKKEAAANKEEKVS